MVGPSVPVGPGCEDSTAYISAAIYPKKGAVQFEPPHNGRSFQDAVVNLSLEKYTNISEVNVKNITIFLKFKGG